MWNFLGGLVSGIGSYFGMKSKAEQEAANRAQEMAMFREQQAFQNKQFEAQQANLQRSEALQREFAQSGVRWRVEDAVKAGLHPLAALGSGGAAFSPGSVTVGGVSAPNLTGSASSGGALAAMSQDVGRAIMATRSGSEREEAFNQTVREMQLQNMTLRNDLLMSQIQRLKANSNPPMPAGANDIAPDVPTDLNLPHEKLKGVTPIVIGGTKIRQDPGMSNASEFEERYGETMSDWVFGPYIAWRDFNTHILEPAAQRQREREKRWHGEISYRAAESYGRR